VTVELTNDTGDAAIAGLEVGGEVALTRSGVDQRPYTHVARGPPRAAFVEQRRHVVRTADVERASDTAPDPHASVQR